MPEACRVAVSVSVVRLDSWAAVLMVPGAWSVRCANSRSFDLSVLLLGVLRPFCSLPTVAEPGVCSFLRVTHDMHLVCIRTRDDRHAWDE